MKRLKTYLPILSWLPGYSGQELKGDLSAGLTVGVMLIPQGMAYSMLAGLPPIYGLYASLIPLLVYALFGTSRQLAVGPVAMVALLISSGVGALAAIGSESFITMAILLALMVGVLQFSLGLFRLGFLVNFLSHPVISGFTSAAALIIGFSQLKHLLGVNIPRSHHIHEILYQAGLHFNDVHWPTLLLGLIAMGIIIGIKKIHKMIPGPLVAVIIGTLSVYFFQLQEGGMKIVKEVPEGLPSFALPALEWSSVQSLLPIALTIALVGFMESIAVAKAIQAKHKNYELDANQELIGLGLANIFGAFFRSFPVTGGFSRSAVNDQAGAKTGMAAIISAALIGLTLLFLTPLFYYLPKSILAAIIMVAVFGLIDYKEVIHLWKTDRKDLALLLLTFVSTLSFGIETGIAIGVGASVLVTLHKSSYPHVAQLGKIETLNHYRNTSRYSTHTPEGILIVRFDAQLFYANAAYFKDALKKMEAARKDPVHTVILDAAGINTIDSTGVHLIQDLIREYKERNIHFIMAQVKGPVRDLMNRAQLMDLLGTNNLFFTVEEAVETCQPQQKTHHHQNGSLKNYATLATQSNY